MIRPAWNVQQNHIVLKYIFKKKKKKFNSNKYLQLQPDRYKIRLFFLSCAHVTSSISKSIEYITVKRSACLTNTD